MNDSCGTRRSDSETICQLLATWEYKEGFLPVIAKLAIGITILGEAKDQHGAETMGLLSGVVCENISLAETVETKLSFYLLH